MEIINKIVDAILSNLDFGFMLCVNVLTFIGIKMVDEVNKQKKVNKWSKRLIALLAGLVLAIPLYFTHVITVNVLLYSFVLSLVSWDFIFKPIAKTLKINYKK